MTDVSVRFGAQVGDLLTALDKVNEKDAQSIAFLNQHRDAINQFDAKLSQLVGALDPAAAATKRLGQSVEMLDSALKMGMVDLDQHAKLTKAAEQAWGQGAEGAKHMGRAIGEAGDMTVGTKRELMVLAHEMVSGNFSRVPGSMLVLAERTGSVSSAFMALLNPITLAIGAVVGVGGAIAVAVMHSEELQRSLNKLETAFVASGRSIGMHRADMEALIHVVTRLHDMTAESAVQVIEAFARQREIGGQTMAFLTTHIDKFAMLMGVDAPQAAKMLAEALAHPDQGMKTLDKTLGGLSANQRIAIEDFVRLGNSARAQEVLVEFLNQKLKELGDSGLTDVQRGSDGLAASWNRLMEAMGHSEPIENARRNLANLFNTISAWIGGDEDRITALNSKIAFLRRAKDEAMTSMARNSFAEQLKQAEEELDHLQGRLKRGTDIVTNGAGPAGTADGGGNKDEGIKKVLDATTNLKGVEEQRRVLNQQIAALTEAQKNAEGDAAKQISERLAEAKRQMADLNKPDNAESQIEKWKRELDERTERERMSVRARVKYDLEYWDEILTHQTKGTKDYDAVLRERNKLKKQASDEEYKAEIAKLDAQIEANKHNSAARIKLIDQEMALARKRYDEDSAEYQRLQQRKTQILEQAETERKQIEDLKLQASRDHAKSEAAITTDELSFKRQMGMINAQEEIAEKKKALDQETAAEARAIQERLKLHHNDLVERQKLQNQLAKLEDKYRQDKKRLDQQMVLANKAQWESILAPVNNAFQTSIKGMIMGTTTLKMAVANLGQSIIFSIVGAIEEAAGKWIAQHLAMMGISELLGLTEDETATTSAIASIAAAKAEAAGEIPAYAGIGAAAAMASVAAIPFIGWAMAPGVGAAHSALAMSYLAMASAAGGWDRVPQDGAITELHKDEMVLPAYLANPLRDMVSTPNGAPGLTANNSSGPPINVTFNVNAMDSKDAARFFKQHGGAIADSLKAAGRNFHGATKR